MNIQEYTTRISFNGELNADLNTLKLLHRSHVMTVPFEALDVQLGNEIRLSIEAIFCKVVTNHRGGYCYELNHLFRSLLNEVGFECRLVSASIYDQGKLGPTYDHLAIIVDLEEPWLVDVGYGDLFIEPICITRRTVQEDDFKLYKVEKVGPHAYELYESLKSSIDFQLRYRFEDRPRSIAEFAKQNSFKQSAPDSFFVKNRICTLPTKDGRKTLLNDTYKVRKDDKVTLTQIKTDEDLRDLLKNEFNIVF